VEALETKEKIEETMEGHERGPSRLRIGLLIAGLAALLAFGTTITAFLVQAPQSVLLPLVLASFATIAHSACTVKAAPTMLSLRSTPDDEILLTAKLDRFAFWHGIRAAFQLLAFVLLMWALVEADVS